MEAPDPQQPSTFLDCILKWGGRHEAGHRQLLDWYRRLLALRNSHPLLAGLSRKYLRADLLGTTGLAICRHSADGRQQLLTLFNFSAAGLATVIPCYGRGPEAWTQILSSTQTPNSTPAPSSTQPPNSTQTPNSTPAPNSAHAPNSTQPPQHLLPGKPIELPPWSASVYELNALPD
jgi:hypothetical protein